MPIAQRGYEGRATGTKVPVAFSSRGPSRQAGASWPRKLNENAAPALVSKRAGST